eukprot:11444-Heterococcus_DN1.PRE.5
MSRFKYKADDSPSDTRVLGQYELLHTLSKFAFGKVSSNVSKCYRSCLDLDTAVLSLAVAVKLLFDGSKTPRVLKELNREVQALSTVSHKHILQLLDKYDAVNYPNKKRPQIKREVTALVLELAPAGDLFDFIMHTGRLHEDVARTYFAQQHTADDVTHTRTHQSCYSNVLIIHLLSNTAGQCNAGVPQQGSVSQRSEAREYAARWCISVKEAHLPYEGTKADVWSAGVVLFVILLGGMPFDESSDGIAAYKCVRAHYAINLVLLSCYSAVPLNVINTTIDTMCFVQHCKVGDYTRFWLVFAKYGEVFSDGAKALLESMLVCDPAQRATFQGISEHPWLASGTTYTDEQLQTPAEIVATPHVMLSTTETGNYSGSMPLPALFLDLALAAAAAHATLLPTIDTAAVPTRAQKEKFSKRQREAARMSISTHFKSQTKSAKHEPKQQSQAVTVSAVKATGAAPLHDMIPPNSLYSDVEPAAQDTVHLHADSMLDSSSDIGVLATCDISTPPGETLKSESYGIELQVPATQHIEQDTVHLHADSMLDSDSDIGVLATCDISTPPGETLKSESYGIELQVPATQHIEYTLTCTDAMAMTYLSFRYVQQDTVHLYADNDCDNDDNIEVLTTCDIATQPGVLKSNWYDIELHIPTAHSIDVRILPAFELFGQLTRDGTILLPPIVQCTGKIDITAGPLLLKRTFYDQEAAGLPSIWYRHEPSDEWKQHASSVEPSESDTNTVVITVEIKHFTEFALSVAPKPNMSYLRATITKGIRIVEAVGQQSLIGARHPFAQRKFIGNLTGKAMYVVARAIRHVVNEQATSTRSAGLSPAATILKVVVSLGQILSCSRSVVQTSAYNESVGDYSMGRCDPNSITELPYTIPHDFVTQGEQQNAQIVFYTDSDIDTTATAAATMDVYDIIDITSGEVVIICPQRLELHPSHGTIPRNAAEGMSICVRGRVGWLNGSVQVAPQNSQSGNQPVGNAPHA